MPGLSSSRRRSQPITRGRNSETPKRRTGATLEAANFTEPPPKRRRYVTGGPDGGRHLRANKEAENGVADAALVTQSVTRPRSRPSAQKFTEDAEPPPTYQRPRRERRERPSAPKPRYSSAAAATAAMVNGDGFKPREERGWEEFHQDLEIETDLPTYDADDVDGIVRHNSHQFLAYGLSVNDEVGSAGMEDGSPPQTTENGMGGAMQHAANTTPLKRRPGRPPRNKSIGMLQGIITPEAPKVVPAPGPNPREKLTLPKPSFRPVDPFASYEKISGSVDYVDRTMSNVGYQESDLFPQPAHYIRLSEIGIEDDLEIHTMTKVEGEGASNAAAANMKRVEYDMDEQDQNFLMQYNEKRRTEEVETIRPAIFEVVMSFIEKEWHALEKRIPKPNPKPPQTHRPRSSSAAAVNGEAGGSGEEQDTKCAICDDGDCENTNAIVFCDGCDLAVHQECYGVPFIPEGQWLCRKCHLIGNGTPTCIFCPNTDGAFKQTNSSKWSHLLCAIWIPEVSLGNTTFMEPVMDVEKVPKPRWRLTCTICNQKMGACVQCGNKNCFRAFHVTCGRRAKWYLQMKSSHGGPASLDASVLKAFCDKHVPGDWRKNNDVDGATADAVSYYRYSMRGKIWADSQQTAASIQATQKRIDHPLPVSDESLTKTVTSPGKKKAGPPAKPGWRLPSGAFVIPAVVYDSVETLLTRLTVRQKKVFAEDMCKYWTLKRENRRGAALIKRLQLQMEMFSSMEITRRDFAAMGAAGGPRLKRRKSFTQTLQHDSTVLKQLAESVVERQQLMVDDDFLLDDLINTLYFPIGPLLRPMMDKAISLNGKGFFQEGLEKLRLRLDERYYVSSEPFFCDLVAIFVFIIGVPSSDDGQASEDRSGKPDWSSDQKEKLKVAKRIIRAIQPVAADAYRKEAELLSKPLEKEPSLLNLLDQALASHRSSVGHSKDLSDSHASATAVVGEALNGQDVEMTDEAAANSASAGDLHDQSASLISGKRSSTTSHPTPDASISNSNTNSISDPSSHHDSLTIPKSEPPPTPPLSSSSTSKPSPTEVLAFGGVPTYMQAFSPDGTTIYDERWDGRDVARGMSEELSDMDDEELSGLVDPNMDLSMHDIPPDGVTENVLSVPEAGPASAKKKNGKTKKRWRGFR